jgi:hypothetical protein
MDWRRGGDYAFTAELDAAGWAWQFLRRCPEYRADHLWFITTWRVLEADYGVPPRRDFFRWKQDSRAWRAEAEIAGCGADVCPGENDRVLIECWMGAKWGFRKFPIDPAIDFPEELSWREQPIGVETVSAAGIAALPPERIALAFDLSLPLDAQLEAARRELALRRHSLAKSGRLPPLSARQGAPIWGKWLRLLDGLEAGASLSEIGRGLDLADPTTEAREALAMRESGYRRILMLPD